MSNGTDETPELTFSLEAVTDAVNRAANDIAEAVDSPNDEGLTDALNLMVNATMGYLTGTTESLAEVAEKFYDEADIDEIVEWIRAGIR